MKIKFQLDWKKVLLFLLVSAGLVYLTKSLLMSIGIVLILFVIDGLVANWEYRKKTHKIFEELRKEHEERLKKEQK
ncbi:MAG: hypothetical protein KAZ98_00715 [Prevotella sp.]|nr:hypothetical protein [Prevotella sp.]